MSKLAEIKNKFITNAEDFDGIMVELQEELAKRDHVIECAINLVTEVCLLPEEALLNLEMYLPEKEWANLFTSIKPFMPDTMTHKQTRDK